jgi:hypothetical protein
MILNMDIGAARQEAIAVLDITAGGPCEYLEPQRD